MPETPVLNTLTVGLLQTRCYVLYLPGRSDCAVIDPGADPGRILEACGGRSVSAILLTHGHFDHIGAVDTLIIQSNPGAAVYLHSLDILMLTDPSLNAGELFGLSAVSHANALPISEGDTVRAAGLEFSVMHTPGHTPGSVCYKINNLLFTGDTLFEHGYGRTDLPGGDQNSMIASLRRLVPYRASYTILPGHGD